VLSQQPFVLHLDDGARLVALARGNCVKLAVKQNGRRAPHLSWIREPVLAKQLGEVQRIHAAFHWNRG